MHDHKRIPAVIKSSVPIAVLRLKQEELSKGNHTCKDLYKSIYNEIKGLSNSERFVKKGDTFHSLSSPEVRNTSIIGILFCRGGRLLSKNRHG